MFKLSFEAALIKNNKMKRLIFFGTSLLFLVFVLFVMKKSIELPQDMYQLSDSIFIEKIDYFSDYRLIKKMDSDYEIINASISGINKISNLLVCYSSPTKKYFVISENSEVQQFESLESIKKQYSFYEISFLSPWQFIENYKKHDFSKTIREVIVILIVLFVVLLLRVLIMKLKSSDLSNN